MPALYLDMQGAVLHKEAGEFVVRFSGQNQHVPKAQVERIIILGNVQLTTQVIADVLQHQVPVFFLSSHGRFRGSLSAPSHANVRLRMKQYACVREETLALPFARWLVIGKIRNLKEMLGRRLKDAKQDAAAMRKQLKYWMNAAGRTRSLDKLRGIEGMAARDYFQYFPTLFSGSPFIWKGRNRRPPKDPINAILSLGYTMLLQECVSAIEVLGLDVHAGLLHGGLSQSDYGQPSLALDLMEEFRYLVDRLMLRLLLSGECSIEDFEYTQHGACFLSGALRKDFFQAWELLMQTPIKYDHRRLGYRLIIAEQAGLLARALQDESLEYRPFMP